MKILCLCALYNHRHETTENAAQCFLDQTHKDASLMLIDDRPQSSQIKGVAGERMHWLSLGERAKCLPAKYNIAIEAAKQAGIPFDAVSIFDGDDGFLPRHLEIANKALEESPGGWSYPDVVLTTFGNVVHKEPSAGRFWSSIVVSREMLNAMGGFLETKACGHDQMFLDRATQYRVPVRPGEPSYCYRWDPGSAENHTSGYSQGFDDTSWWQNTPHSNSGRIVVPAYNNDWREKLAEIRQNFPELLPEGFYW